MRTRNLPIGTRLTLAFAAVLAITAAIAIIGVWRLGSLKDSAHEIATVELQRSLLAQRRASQININWVRASAALKTSDVGYIDALHPRLPHSPRLPAPPRPNRPAQAARVNGRPSQNRRSRPGLAGRPPAPGQPARRVTQPANAVASSGGL